MKYLNIALACVLVLVVLPLLAISILGNSDDAGTAETARTSGRSDRELRSGSASVDGAFQVEDGIGNEWDVEFGDHESEGVEELPDGWTRFAHPSGAFVVELPGVPSRVELSGPPLTAFGFETHNWQSIGFRGDVTMLTWVALTPELASELAADLDAAIDGYVMGAEMASGAQFVDERVIDVSGHSARLFNLEGPDDVDGAVILVVGDSGILSLTLFARDGDHIGMADRALAGLAVD